MHADRTQLKSERIALNISLWSSSLFVLLELIMSVITSSQAVLLDAVYDGIEFLMVIVSLTLIPLFYRSSNEKHPFGYLQVESLFVVLKGTIMVVVTMGLMVNNITILLHGGHDIDFSIITWFELFACIVSIIVILLLGRFNSSLNSPTVSMEIQEWKIDAACSIGMAAAFFLPAVIRAPWFLPLVPYLDQCITIILCVCMLPTPVRAVISGLRDLFLLPPDEETTDHIKEIVTPILSAYGYNKLYFDIVKTGRKLWISVYITFDKDEVSISRFRIVQNFIIQALKKDYQNFYFELLPDIEYGGETEVL